MDRQTWWLQSASGRAVGDQPYPRRLNANILCAHTMHAISLQIRSSIEAGAHVIDVLEGCIDHAVINLSGRIDCFGQSIFGMKFSLNEKIKLFVWYLGDLLVESTIEAVVINTFTTDSGA